MQVEKEERTETRNEELMEEKEQKVRRRKIREEGIEEARMEEIEKDRRKIRHDEEHRGRKIHTTPSQYQSDVRPYVPVRALCLWRLGRWSSPSRKLKRKTHRLSSAFHPVVSYDDII